MVLITNSSGFSVCVIFSGIAVTGVKIVNIVNSVDTSSSIGYQINILLDMSKFKNDVSAYFIFNFV